MLMPSICPSRPNFYLFSPCSVPPWADRMNCINEHSCLLASCWNWPMGSTSSGSERGREQTFIQGRYFPWSPRFGCIFLPTATVAVGLSPFFGNPFLPLPWRSGVLLVPPPLVVFGVLKPLLLVLLNSVCIFVQTLFGCLLLPARPQQAPIWAVCILVSSLWVSAQMEPLQGGRAWLPTVSLPTPASCLLPFTLHHNIFLISCITMIITISVLFCCFTLFLIGP